MKIGLYLAYPPARNISLYNEGLGRYMGMLVKTLKARNNDITLACPPWLLEPLVELLYEFNVSEESIRILTLPEPAIWIISGWLDKRRHKKERIKKQPYHIVSSIYNAVFDFLVKTKHIVFILLLLIAAILCVIIMAPFLLVYELLHCLARAALKIARTVLGKSISFFDNAISRFFNVQRLVNNSKGRALLSIIWDKMLMVMRDSICSDLIYKINHEKYKQDVWFTPTAYWKEFSRIRGVAITCFPDLTPAIFPESFSQWDYAAVTDIVRDVTSLSKYIIAYCDYQKIAMLVNTLGRDPACIRSIGLFVNEVKPYIDVSANNPSCLDSTASRHFARHLLNDIWQNSAPDIQPYLSGPFRAYGFKDMKYIFYSSQCRPNKNMMTLVKAYEYLLRKKEASFKLVLTGNLSDAPEIKEYVYKNHLQFDIITFSRVSNQQLAALYACAELVVNPTLYEGGFLMIFSEGMSVGTPSVMSRIPQVTDVADPYDIDDCLFDPSDYKDMANKILYGICHRDELVKRQQPLYDVLSKWCSEDAGRCYEDAFRYFIGLDKQLKEDKTKARMDN